MEIPVRYQPRLLTPEERAGYLDWSLDFFTDDRLLQIPYIDLTLQLDVTNAYGVYQQQKDSPGSFFCFFALALDAMFAKPLGISAPLLQSTMVCVG